MGAASTEHGLVIEPIPGAPFGAQIQGLVPLEITQQQTDAIWQTYKGRHGLICFEFGRLLEADELHALTAIFGENEFAPGRIFGLGRDMPKGKENVSVEEQVAAFRAKGEDPYMAYIGNLNPKTLEKNEKNEKFYGEWEWHTDMSYIEVPPTFSLLHAREIPDHGGDTGFCSQVMAAMELPDSLRERVAGVRVKHDSTYGSSGIPRPGMTPPASPVEAIGYPHPVALRHLADTPQNVRQLAARNRPVHAVVIWTDPPHRRKGRLAPRP